MPGNTVWIVFFLFLGIVTHEGINLRGLSNAKAILAEEQQ